MMDLPLRHPNETRQVDNSLLPETEVIREVGFFQRHKEAAFLLFKNGNEMLVIIGPHLENSEN